MRPSWDTYYMQIAEVVASRATCDRRHVGSIIVVNKCIVSTGFNGAPRGLPHCDSQGHDLVDFNGRASCVRTAHSETNAIAQAARRGVAIEGGTLFTTASSCWDCAKLIVNAGIIRVVAKEVYQSRYGKSDDVTALFLAAGVESEILNSNGGA